MLFIFKARNLSILTKYFLKSEILSSLSCTAFQRAVVSNVLNYNTLTANNEHDIFSYKKSPEPELKNLGKVVDLDGDFNELIVDGKGMKKKKKRGERKYNLNKNMNLGDRATNDIMNENIKLTDKNDLKESKSSSDKKPKYISLNERSKIFSSVMLKLKSRKLREKSQQIVLEGRRLIHDGIAAGFLPLQVFASRVSDAEELCLPNNVKIYQVPRKCIQLWSDVVTTQSIMAVFEKPKLIQVKKSSDTLPLIVICDNIRDPGNLGSILRVAASVGCEKLILTKGCTDVWQPKVLRAGAGTHFRLSIVNNLQWSDIESEVSETSRVVLSDFADDSALNEIPENESVSNTSIFRKRSEISESLPVTCYSALKYGNENTVIVIGGETMGLSNEAYEFAAKRKGTRAFIPMSNKVESLNSSVALGIISYEFKRQFDFITGKNYHIDNSTSVESNESNQSENVS